MLAKLLSWKIGGLAILAATAVWASYGPDSILQNNIADNLRAWQAHGRLVAVSDTEPLGERYPIILIFGLNSSSDADGPPEDEISRMANGVLSDWQSSYRNWTGREFVCDTKVYGFWYNSDAADSQIAQWLDARVETEPDLTKAGVRWSGVCHSKGGNVLFCYWVQTNNRKLDAKVTSATPHLGTIMADHAAIEQAIRRAFTFLGKWLDKLLGDRGMNFDAPGIQWLLPNYPPMMALREKHSLDTSWTLVGGKVKPAGDGVISRNLALGWLLDRALLAGGNDQDVKAYQIGALIMQKAGVAESDGVVPLSSALCEGYAGKAQTILLASEHNHSQMWWGNSGMELHDAMLKPLMPYILAGRENTEIPHLTMWLPEMPVITIPKIQTDRLERARLVWINEDGGISVADSQFANPCVLYLPDGKYSWPQWMGNDILATWSHCLGDDVILISDGRVTQLTNDGKSSLATGEAGMVAFVSGGDLMLRTMDGATRVLVCGPLLMDYPPVIMGKKLYFSVSNPAGGADLRWVSTVVNDYPLARTRLVDNQVMHPMKIGQVLLAVRIGSDDSAVTVVTGRWGALRATLTAGMKSLSQMLSDGQIPVPTLVDMDSRENWLYLVVGDDIRQLDVATIAQTVVNGDGSMTLDQAAVWRATATQFDVK